MICEAKSIRNRQIFAREAIWVILVNQNDLWPASCHFFKALFGTDRFSLVTVSKVSQIGYKKQKKTININNTAFCRSLKFVFIVA